MDTNQLLIYGFTMAVGGMIMLISMCSLMFMLFYQIKNKEKVNNYAKGVIMFGLIFGFILFAFSMTRINFSAFNINF